MSLAYREYEADFYSWATGQAAELRAGNFSQLDRLNIAEELETLARSEKRALAQAFTRLFYRLLLWKHLPGFNSASTRLRAESLRREVHGLMQHNPSLLPRYGNMPAQAYENALIKVQIETGFAENMFSAELPWAMADVLAKNWVPE